MFDIGFMELMVIGTLGLLILGPERLPKAAHAVGLIIGRVRNSVSNIQADLERHVRTEELKARLRDPASTFFDDDVRDPARLTGGSSEHPPQKTPEPLPHKTPAHPEDSDSGRQPESKGGTPE